MSTLELEMAHSMDCLNDCECRAYSNTLSPGSIHGYEAWKQDQKWKLMQIVKAQSEDCPEGWRQLFCVETDAHMLTSMCSLEAFVDEVIELGWAVESVDRASVVCPACQDPEIELTEDEERMDEKVYSARKDG